MSELLAPAGTLDKLKWAVQYGADAVYLAYNPFPFAVMPVILVWMMLITP
jgi:Collagenase and related proteases